MNQRVGMSLFALVAIVAMASAAGAAVLWDQSAVDLAGPGYFNSISGAPPMGLTMYTVNDVTVGPGGWTVNTIKMYFNRIDPNWGGAITEGRLHVFPKTGALPVNGTDDPEIGQIVPMTATLFDTYFELTATGLNLALAPGDYWIGITPFAPSGFFGPETLLSTTTLLGDATASYDPFGSFGPPLTWFVLNPGVDCALLIEGDLPTPVESASWGDIKVRFQN